MKPYFKLILLTVSLFLILLFIVAKSPVRAGAAHFPTIEEVQQMITNALSPFQTSVQSLTSRVSNLEATVTPMPGQIANIQASLTPIPGQITDINTTLSPIPSEINDLKNKIQDLQNNQQPQPTDFIFLSGVFPATGGTTSPIFDAQGYTKIAFTWNCPVGATPILLETSPDQVLWGVQATYGSPEHCFDSSVTLNTAGRYYKVVLGGSTNFTSITVNAFGHFFN